MVIEDFFSKVIFLDTAPLIYFIEGHSKHQTILSKIFESNDKGRFSFLTTSITLLEVLVKPFRDAKYLLAEQYKDVLTKAPGIEICDVTPEIAEKAALLRAIYNVSTPDAIQLSAAIEGQCQYFLTNDIKLSAVKEIKVVTLPEIT